MKELLKELYFYRGTDTPPELCEKIRAELEKPEPDPVAWMNANDGPCNSYTEMNFMAKRWGNNAIPLYTHPPRKQEPLSEDALVKIALEVARTQGQDWVSEEYIRNESGVFELVRAVEKAHGIGEK